MNIKLGPPKTTDLKPRITVIGIGGAGCNAVNNMIATQLDGVEFVVANTDAQSLNMSNAERRIQLGTNLTEGLGAGAKPEVGEAAAREAEEDIRAEIAGSHMVFIAAGMGGGTGTGAATVIAEIARDLGILTVAIVSKPFQFEGARRMRTAEAGIATLEQVVDTLIVIPNQNLFRIANERTTFAEAFRLADQVLYSGIACIVDLIVKEGLINLDFADVQAVMKGMGTAMMGTGEASGEDRALTAANEAIANPLLDNITLSGAQGLLISIVGGSDLTLYEVDTAASHIRKEVAADANIIVGATTEEGMTDRLRVSIVASGLSLAGAAAPASHQAPAPVAPPARSPLPAPVAAKAAATNVDTAPKTPVPAATTSYSDGDFAVDGEADYRPPEVPVSDSDEMNATEADAFAQALSEAMQGSARAEVEDEQDAASWQSPDGVVIEEGFNDGRGSPAPPPLPMRTQQSRQSEQDAFEPAVPAEVRRGVPRMPDVSEFPEVAQREYFAKLQDNQRADRPKGRQEGGDEARHTPARASQPPPRPQSKAPADELSRPLPAGHESAAAPRERPGLLRRLTGGSRK